MKYLVLVFIVVNLILNMECAVENVRSSTEHKCKMVCPEGDTDMTCGFEAETRIYKLFASKCAMASHADCYNKRFVETPLMYCFKNLVQPIRRFYDESCPVFCPTHYRPVCGASKLRSYKYRTFNNGCYLDMLNCRGDEDDGYVEVPLHFCPNHLMKNIFKEQVIVSQNNDYKDYHEY